MQLKDLQDQLWHLALCKTCMACGGTGRVKRHTASNAMLSAGYYGSSEHDDGHCSSCLNGFIFLPLAANDALTMLVEGFFDRLEEPKNQVLRQRFLDLYITNTELRMLGKTP